MILGMPAPHFFMMNRKIDLLYKEEEIRGLAIVHNSKPGERIQELSRQLRSTGKVKVVTASALQLLNQHGGKDGVAVAVESGKIQAIRERQKAAMAERDQNRAAWIQKIREQAAQQQAKT